LARAWAQTGHDHRHGYRHRHAHAHRHWQRNQHGWVQAQAQAQAWARARVKNSGRGGGGLKKVRMGQPNCSKVGTGHLPRIQPCLKDRPLQQQCCLIQQSAHTFERAGFILLGTLSHACTSHAARGAQQRGVVRPDVLCSDLVQLCEEGTHLCCQQACSARDLGVNMPLFFCGRNSGCCLCQTGRKNH